MKKVLLRFYDKHNLGDDLFVKVITERYENHFSLLVLKDNQFLQNIKHLTIYNNTAFYLFCKAIEKLFGIRNIWLGMLAKRHDLLVYIGGSIFIEDNNIQKWKNEQNFYRGLSAPYYILGSNFGPYKNSEFISLISDIFRGAKDVCFRDNASYELFKELDTTRVATDIAFSLDTSKYKIKNEKIAVFSIINCADRFDKKVADKYDQETVNMTRQLIKGGYKVVYMSFCKYEGDEDAIQRIMNNFNKDIVNNVEAFNYDGNLEEALSLIAKCEIIVASRFHGVILGLLFSKKVLPMAYSKKTSNILNDLKFKGDIIDINTIDTFDGNKFDFDSLQINNVDKQVQLADLQFQELDKVLVRKN